MPLSIIIVRLLAFISGLLLIYVAVFIYEDEQGKLQNKLEDWWIQIDDTQQVMLSRHTNLMRYIANMLSSVIDRLFGERLLSLQSIGVSACYSYASVNFVSILYILIGGVKYLDIDTPLSNMSISVVLFLLIVGTIHTMLFLFLGTLPSFTPGIVWKIVWAVSLSMFFILLSIGMYLMVLALATDAQESSPQVFAIYYTAITLTYLIVGISASTAFSTAFIAITRKILRWSAGLDSTSKIVAMILLNSALPIVLIAAPLVWIYMLIASDLMSKILQLSEIAGIAISMILVSSASLTAVSNTVPALLSFLFVGLALIMLAHRIFWPLLSRLIYSLQRLGIAKRSKLLGTLGALLVVTGIGGWTWVEKLVDKLNPF